MQKVNWYEGMEVKPHHFQQDSLYIENKFKTIYKTNPFFWGISDFSLNLGKFNNGIISVDKGLITFPSGETLDVTDVFLQDYIIPKTITGIFKLYLGIKELGNIDDLYSGFDTEVDDLTEKNNRAIISKLKRKVFILQEKELNNQFSYFPFLKLLQVGNSFSFQDYTCPANKLENSGLLYNKINELIGVLKSYISFFLWKQEENKFFEEYKQVFFFIHLETLNLETMIFFHPFEIYKIILKIAGCLSFGKPVGVFQYQHNEIYESYMSVLNYINMILEQLHIKSEYLDLKEIEINKFSIYLDPTIMNNNTIDLIFICKNKTDIGKEVSILIDQVPNIKICTDDFEEEVVLKRIIGADRDFNPSISEAVLQKCLVLSVKTSKFITMEKNLLIFGIDFSSYKLVIRK